MPIMIVITIFQVVFLCWRADIIRHSNDRITILHLVDHELGVAQGGFLPHVFHICARRPSTINFYNSSAHHLICD